MRLISRLEDEIRRTLQGLPGLTEEQENELAAMESRLVDLFMEYAAEHFKLVTK